MGKIRKTLSFIIHKILGVQYRTQISEYERENILAHDTKFFITVNQNGVLNILPGIIDDPQIRAAGYSLAYFLAREIVDFDFEIQRQLRKLERMNVPNHTPNLDELLEQTEERDEFSKYFNQSLTDEKSRNEKL